MAHTRDASPLEDKHAVLLSRQRVVGAASGSGFYLLSIARVLAEAGYAVHFLGVSPKLFGRWPLLRLRPEMGVFASVRIRGGLRLGRWFWCTNPIVYLQALSAGIERMAVALGLPALGWTRRAENAIRAPIDGADARYSAYHTRNADLILCDYAFLTPLAASARADGVPIMVIMHDLLSANITPHASAADVVARHALHPEEEFRLLAKADVVLAIQPEEAAIVRRRLPTVTTLLAPCAMTCAPAPQPGEDDHVLFVGSNTHFNAEGLAWFLKACWPAVRAARPHARLHIVGSVSRRFGLLPEGVMAFGVIEDLADIYASAGVVIVPVLGGAGLKIKLVEALAAGKAIVSTSAAAKGIQDQVVPAVVMEDEPDRFAAAVVALMDNRAKRQAQGRAALQAASQHFSDAACYVELRRWLATRRPRSSLVQAMGGPPVASPAGGD